MNNFSRRHFLQGSSATALSAFALGAVHSSNAASAASGGDTLRVGVIGIRGRGKDHIKQFSRANGSKVVALSDVDSDVLDERAAKFEEEYGYKPQKFADYRELIKNKGIDIVAIATPNHWHALMTIEACQAGKHVYCEKPVCHSVWEGRKILEAMRRYDGLVCAGFQNRSDTGLVKAFPWVQEGNLGKITAIRGLCNRKRGSIGLAKTPTRPPRSVNYDLWLGPAQDLPIVRPQFHYDWHWIFNTGNGDVGNQGPHEMDLINWVLGDPGAPKRVRSLGGRFGWNDAGNTPNMLVTSFDFGDGVPVHFEVRNLHNKQDLGRFKQGPEVGLVITCEGGEFRGGRGGGKAYDEQGKVIREFPGDSGNKHMQLFVNAVRANDPELIPSKLPSAFGSSCMSHLANASVQVGQTVATSDVTEFAGEDQVMQEALGRYTQQMEAAEVDFSKNSWHIGPELTFDRQEEQFIAGDNVAAANALLKREYRAPYVVPEAV